jgi:cobalt transporter subunit CbtB
LQGETRKPSGVTAMETMMNTTQTTAGLRSSVLMQSVFAMTVGALIVFASGFAHSATLHDAAHDMRHSTGFPCH